MGLRTGASSLETAFAVDGAGSSKIEETTTMQLPSQRLVSSAALAASLAVLLPSTVNAVPLQGGATPSTTPPPAIGAGAALPWQQSSQLHPSFQVNLATGNVLFQFATSGYLFPGLAPSHSLSLCFNSQAVAKPGDYTAGFELGQGWSTTIGTRLDFPTSSSAVLTLGDGGEIDFELNGAEWEAPDGFHSKLIANGTGWIVRDKAQTDFHFDASGKHTQVVSASGNALIVTYVGSKAMSVTEASGRSVSFSYAAGGELDSFADSAGSTWSVSYDALGRLSGIDDPEFGSVTVTYDTQGRIDSVSDLDDHLWLFEYVSAGAWQGRVESITDPVGAVESYAYSSGPTKDQTVVTDSRGNSWRYFFDRADSPALVRMKTPLDAIWRYTYDADRNLTSWTDPLGKSGMCTYDGNGNLLTFTDEIGDVTELEYDSLWNVTAFTVSGFRTDYSYDDSAHPTSVTKIELPADANGARATTNLSYHGPQAGPTPGQWNGQLSSVTDPAGAETRFEYDEFGIMTTTSEGPFGASGGVEVRYDVDTLPVYIDLGGMLYPTHFPSLPARPSQVTGRLVQHPVTAYNVDWRGNEIARPLTVDAPIDTGSGSESSTYDRIPSFDHRGRRTLDQIVSDESLAHVATPPTTVPARTFSFSYDDTAVDGEMTGTTPDGDSMTALHDAEGRTTSFTVTNPAGDDLTIDSAYNARGELTSESRSDGTSTEYTYTDDGNVDTIVHRDGTAVLLALDYEYDARDLPVSVSEVSTAGRVVRSFTYDSRDQLIEETRTLPPLGTVEARAYSYDLAGNRTGYERRIDGVLAESALYHYDHEDPSTYQSKHNRLTWVEHFDSSGALTSTTWLFYYNPFGHASDVVERTAGSSSYSATRFVYDSAGRPWLSWEETWTDNGIGPVNSVRGEILETRQDGWQQRLWRKRDPQTLAPLGGGEWISRLGQLGASFTADPTTGAAVRQQLDVDGVGRLGSGDTETYGFDAVGSARLRKTNSAQASQVFTAFGVVLQGDAGSELGFSGEFGTRQALDGQALSSGGMVKMGFRHYAPELGRFLMRDPIGIFGGLGVYTFVGNTPTAWVDPLGLSQDKPRTFEDMDEWEIKGELRSCYRRNCPTYQASEEYRDKYGAQFGYFSHRPKLPSDPVGWPTCEPYPRLPNGEIRQWYAGPKDTPPPRGGAPAGPSGPSKPKR